MKTQSTIEFKTRKEAIKRIEIIKQSNVGANSFKIIKTINNLFTVSYKI